MVGEVDQTGTLQQSESFGAWGDRAQVLQADPRAEDRGYTGHEHLTEVNLVHMNGRVYDTVTGRFLGPATQTHRRNRNPGRASALSRTG